MHPKRLPILFSAILFCLVGASNANAQFTFDRSTVFNDATYSSSSVSLIHGANPPTIGTVGSGADISLLFAQGDSRANITGSGSVGLLDIQDQSRSVLRQNGQVLFAVTEGSSRLSVEGGNFVSGLTFGNSRALISGGSFGVINASDSSQVMFTGGNYVAASLLADTNANLVFNRGTFDSSSQIVTAGSSHATIRGGQMGAGLVALESSVIDIFGKNLAINSFGHLTGFLSDGSIIDTIALSDGTGQYVIHSTPEPASLALLAFGSAPLIWAAIRRRRKN